MQVDRLAVQFVDEDQRLRQPPHAATCRWRSTHRSAAKLPLR